MKVKIVMLETTNESNIILGINLLVNIPGKIRGTKFHIYLIDESAEIKEGDWCIHLPTNKLVQSSYNRKDNYLQKIIALTDSLEITMDYHGESTTEEDKICYSENLPQLSEQSIKLLLDYCNQNGKMPEYVEVEEQYDTYGWIGNVKLNSQNQVDMTIPEEKVYSRKEVEELFERYFKDNVTSHKIGDILKNKGRIWLNKNL